MVSSSGTNVFLIPTVHYTTCSVADLFWPGRPRAPKRSHVTGSPQMQLEIPITPNHLVTLLSPRPELLQAQLLGCWTGSASFGASWAIPNLWECQTVHFSLLGLVSWRKTEANSFFSSLLGFQELWSCGPSGVRGSGGGTGPVESRLEPFSSTGSLLLAGNAGGNWRPSLQCCC